MNLKYLIPFAGSLILFGVALFIGMINYRQYAKNKFSFLSMFPYEMNDKIKMKLNTAVRVGFILFGISYIFVYVFVFKNYTDLLSHLIIGIECLLIILMIIMTMTDMRIVKAHLLSFSLFSALTLISEGMLIWYCFDYKTNIVYDFLPYVCGFVLLLSLGIIINPGLKNWAKMKTNEKGEVIRPRVFILALSEWLMIEMDLIVMMLVITGIK